MPDRDQIPNHVYGAEGEEWAPKLGVDTPRGAMLAPDGLRQHRDRYVEAIRACNDHSRPARTSPLQFLPKRTCYHLLDHAREMEDEDVTGKDQVAS